MARENSYILLFMDHFGCRADMFTVTTANFTVEGTANILANSGNACPPTFFENGPQLSLSARKRSVQVALRNMSSMSS